MGIDAWIHGLYTLTAVFGVGVTAVDMLGLLATDSDTDGDSGDGGDDGSGHDGGAHDHGGDSSHDHASHSGVLSVLRYLRTLIYFSLGFGPTGLVAELMGRGVFGSLIWAVPGGVASMLLARAFFRFQQRDVDSSLKPEDLLFEPATVLVSLSHKDMGKVRVRAGQIIAERYALSSDAEDTFRVGEEVEIVEVTDQCVYVRRPMPPEHALEPTPPGIDPPKEPLI